MWCLGLLPLHCISSLHRRLHSESNSMRSRPNPGCTSLCCRLQSERMSVGRKKQQIAALDQAVHQARHDYNQKFMALAKLKEECIAQEPQPQKVGSQPLCWLADRSKEVVPGAVSRFSVFLQHRRSLTSKGWQASRRPTAAY